ncbi:polysaccharide biosynthesis/export protein [Antarctobacter heliothermus]|uniref:Polysaccharide biosynthesis/export protein n=1 Tax=Antarctobacter heliothermus TaxID=74033 RepID=A0A222DZB2_9RHOB|nr:polysaccharide biosynthesis/export protein [Antarctobacter heliothermus]
MRTGLKGYKNLGAWTRCLVLALGGAVALSSCGISYNSPKVSERNGELPVSVVGMTARSVAYANASPYTPRALPDVFYAYAGSQGSVTGAGALPAAPYLPDETRRQMEYRPLPDINPQPYRIGVGDVVLLATRSSASTIEQLSGLLAAQNQRQGYTVRDDGSIAIPEIGAVQLSGLTLQEAEDRLFQALVSNQIDPSFSLEVAEFRSKKVAVGGAVKSATLVPITPNNLTLGEALIAAGGLVTRDEEFASIRIYRDGTLYQIPVETFRAQPQLSDKLLIAGDAVYVDTTYDLDRAFEFYKTKIDVISLRSSARSTALQTLSSEINIRRSALDERRALFNAREQLGAEKRDYVYLSGEVAKQNRFALPYGQQATLADVLYNEGGFDNTTGDPTEIYVLRGSNDPAKIGEIVAYHLNAGNAANMILATKFEMRPNDVIFIEEQPITKWGRALQQTFPTLLNSATSAL